MTTVRTFDKMLGKTIQRIVGGIGSDKMQFISEEKPNFLFWHCQDCCESVAINDIIGDLSDLIGSPLVLAEQISSVDAGPPRKSGVDSYTWTFYRFGTAKGTVTIRWLGESNGYYGEGVDFEVQY